MIVVSTDAQSIAQFDSYYHQVWAMMSYKPVFSSQSSAKIFNVQIFNENRDIIYILLSIH